MLPLFFCEEVLDVDDLRRRRRLVDPVRRVLAREIVNNGLLVVPCSCAEQRGQDDDPL